MSLTDSALTALGGLLVGLATTGGLLWHQHKALAAARRAAYHDDLTGLPNRRALTAHLDAALRHDRRIAVALLDVDRLKAVNDTHGHATGDLLLRTVASRLHDLPAPVRMAARLSGDEFALVIDGDLEAAVTVARAACRAVCADPVQLGGHPVDVSVSIGVAGWRLGLDGRHLLHDADQAMYEAKAAGGGVHAYAPRPGHTEIPDRPAVRGRDRRRALPTNPPAAGHRDPFGPAG